jgi:hypothetical protein
MLLDVGFRWLLVGLFVDTDIIFVSKYQIVTYFLFCPLFDGQWLCAMGMYIYVCMYRSNDLPEHIRSQ